jgi:TatD DNase family protein
MVYYDIHTHQPAKHPGDIAVISVDLSHEFMQNGILPPKGPTEKQQSPHCINPISNLYSIGIHPWHIDMASMNDVRKYANQPAIVAIGETGLDKIIAKNEHEFRLQQELFSAHAELSEKVRKPLIIHCVKAWDELLRTYKIIKPAMPWIIHGFRGKDILASQLMNAGLYLSFGTLYHMEALKIAWQRQRLLIETDDKRTDIRDVYEQIADDLNISEETLSEAIGVFFKTRFLLSH